MQIYINKNGQQLGPFEDKVVLGMIKNGQVSANDMAIRQNDRQWRTLGMMFPDQFPAEIQTAHAPLNLKPPMNKRLVGGIYVSSVVLFFVGLLMAGITALVGVDSDKYGLVSVGAVIAILAYFQFLVVHLIVMFYILFKMWDSIQDGVSTSTGKAIGFLFIPFFSIYWIFKAWGGYPTEYNQFIKRHQLNVPRLVSSVYVFVPILALLSGLLLPIFAIPFVFMAVISQTSDAVNWLNQGLANKQAGNNQPVDARKESLLSPLLRTAVFGVAGISLFTIVGLVGVGWWNSHPKPTKDELPDTVGNFSKTQDLRFKGSLLGMRKDFGAMYETADKKRAVVYDLGDALNDWERKVYASPGDTKGDVTNSNGNKIGEYSISKGVLSIFNGSKKINIWDLNQRTPTYILPPNLQGKEGKITSLNEAEMLDFAKSLPINSQLKFSEPVASKTPASTSTPNPNLKGGREISATDKADFTMTSEEFYALTKKSDTAQYVGKVFEVTGRMYSLGTYTKLKANIYDSFDVNFSSTQTNTNPKEDEMLKLKCVAVQDYGTLELGNCLILENRGIISAEGSPDFTVTADEYVKNTQNVVNKYRGKVVDITGKVKIIGGKGEYLVTSKSWLTCYPLKGKESDFQSLADGAEVKFRGLGDVSGMKHCIVISR